MYIKKNEIKKDIEFKIQIELIRNKKKGIVRKYWVFI